MRFATNAAGALRVARERKPDPILLDSEMPDGNGFEVCRELKADEELTSEDIADDFFNDAMDTACELFDMFVGG